MTHYFQLHLMHGIEVHANVFDNSYLHKFEIVNNTFLHILHKSPYDRPIYNPYHSVTTKKLHKRQLLVNNCIDHLLL